MQRTFENLNNMPLYRVSLGSKELFHSEFLQTMFEWYPNLMNPILASWMGVDNIKILSSEREAEGYKDLVIVIEHNGQKRKIIIENKVKSLPTEEQILSYSKKKEYHKGILLSLLTVDFLSEGEIKTYGFVQWTSISYKCLFKDLKEILPEIQKKNAKHAMYFEDYLFILEALISIPFEMDVENDTLDMTRNNLLWAALEKIRFQDVYEKIKFRQIALHVLRSLQGNVYFSKDWTNGKRGDVYVYDGYIRRSGLFDVKVVLAPSLCLNVQIQAQTFKLMVEGVKSNQKEVESLAYRMLERGEWFDFEKIPHDTVYPKGDKVFNGYGEIRKSGEQWIFNKSVQMKTPRLKNVIEWTLFYVDQARQIALSFEQ
ncbi:hypothetical protein ACFRH9_25970 [Peribacillus butanolivorans]|uniref:hypothetical protein n=1 Tax=Peribacillus butanolivorans TaxID=421767 RepID=UPI003672258B